ncbi:MAG: hypothetical protein F6K26_04200 [Moorea sp. SIO2I5]|nr:hypothetical protein [Moorena sp. SIO2I5]
MPLAFPSWEGLGVGSSCLLPTPYSLLPLLYYQNPRFPVGSTVVQLVLA